MGLGEGAGVAGRSGVTPEQASANAAIPARASGGSRGLMATITALPGNRDGLLYLDLDGVLVMARHVTGGEVAKGVDSADALV